MEHQVIDTNDRYVMRTLEDFDRVRKEARTPKSPVFVGILQTPATDVTSSPTEIKDADGELVSIKDLKLTFVGSIGGADVPRIPPGRMLDFTMAVARSATFNQRNLPLKEKIVILWKVFGELFLHKNYSESEDPYKRVAEQWYKKYQLAPLDRKAKMKLFWKRVKDMFVFTPQSEPIDTYGMPGFQSFRKAKT